MWLFEALLNDEPIPGEAKGALKARQSDWAPVPMSQTGAESHSVREHLELWGAVKSRRACRGAKGHHPLVEDPEGTCKRAAQGASTHVRPSQPEGKTQLSTS